MTIPKGWFVLYQPKYKTPSVFDLHERGLFTSMPYVSRKSGAYLLINEDIQVSAYYRCIAEGHQVQGHIAYSYIVHKGIIRLTEDMTLNEEELAGIGESDARDEIMRVCEEWYKSYIPLQADSTVDKAELDKKLKSSLNEGKKLFREELKRKNSGWIEPALGGMLWNFRHGLYGLVADDLYPDYRTRGGEDTEDGLIRKIQLFDRIYDSDDPDNLLKPDGKRWQSDDEIWDCWIAYSGSESEARRVCQSMEAVYRPLSARL
jgi:hypothetical protein